MSLFIKKSALFLLISSIFLFFLLGLNFYVVNKSKLSDRDHIGILVLGESTTECGINTDMFINAVNLSKSADSYFYNYLKLKKIIDDNCKVDTLLIAYAPHNTFQFIEDRWLLDKSNMKSRLGNYLPIMVFEDYKLLLSQNSNFSRAVISSAIEHSLKNIIRYFMNGQLAYKYGGFLKRSSSVAISDEDEVQNDFEPAVLELLYLKKIQSLCQQNSIKLILINTPKTTKKLELESYGVSIFNKRTKTDFVGLSYIDASNTSLDSNYYADMMHLNVEGANYFTNFLVSTSLNQELKK